MRRKIIWEGGPVLFMSPYTRSMKQRRSPALLKRNVNDPTQHTHIHKRAHTHTHTQKEKERKITNGLKGRVRDRQRRYETNGVNSREDKGRRFRRTGEETKSS